MAKGKTSLSQAHDQKTEAPKSGSEMVPYEIPPIPFQVAASVREYFRLLGVDVEFDNDEVVQGIIACFPDKSQIRVTGGERGPAVAFHFPSDIPKYIFTDKAIRLIEKMMYKIAMVCKLGYLDIKRQYEDSYTDVVMMGKTVDTTNEKVVIHELDRLTKILRHQKPKRRSRK